MQSQPTSAEEGTTLEPASPPVDLLAMSGAAARALDYLNKAVAEIEPYMILLTDEQRQTLSRAPHQLNLVARDMALNANSHPTLLAACPSYNGEQVISKLEKVEILAPLATKAGAVARLVDDTHQHLLSECYNTTLSLYRVSKGMLRENPKLREIVTPLADVFAARKRNKKASMS